MQEILRINLFGLTLILGLGINLAEGRAKRQAMLMVDVEEWREITLVKLVTCVSAFLYVTPST